MFPGEAWKENFYRSVTATKQALVFGIVDSMIYGNWLFNVVTGIFLPNWVCLWCVSFSKPQIKPELNKDKKKKNQ